MGGERKGSGADDVVRLPRYALRNALVAAARRGAGYEDGVPCSQRMAKRFEYIADTEMHDGLLIPKVHNRG